MGRHRGPLRVLLILAIVAGAAGAAARLVDVYSAPSPWAASLRLTREFVRAAAAHDSAGLARLAGSHELVHWALGSPLADLGSLYAVGGRHEGDTTVVVMLVHGGTCDNRALEVRLLGRGAAARVASLSAPCLPAATIQP